MEGLKKGTIVITGGAGFIGGNLVKQLIKSGNQSIVVIDNQINKDSIYATEDLNLKTTLRIADIRKKELIEEIFSFYNPDFIFHLAAEPIVEEAFDNPYSTFNTNVMGTVNVLNAARKLNNLKAVIVASSDKAYGKTKKAYTEESPLKGDHPYDVSKSAADLISLAYYKTYGLPVVITRFGNVYGEGDFHFGRIVPDICKSVIKNETLLLRSDGTYVRDYLYVGDVVDGYIFLMKNLNKTIGQAFNFSSKDTLSVLSLVKKAEKILNTKIKYKILNTAKNEIPYQHLNDAKIRRLGWANKRSLYVKIEEILKWYRKVL
ncbi:MAG: NAD-dependent epimerase/dehydratase [Candidatus Daviesbacteria bacterium GW2011_GWA2_42_7]|uniref:NAD-dependent epimerase/dehydratase n=4 Tax=Bacteria candidate phyla TaxID=1783234 RepID=A0A0G0LK68_9BACT|nr:MAG: NAD-dependent epimerase/dehydratase [Candidatus Woesebacteria bacterium GW2011_GWB1_39_10]KKS70290.1 MAG: NAD-dependent epimerase/dehydratase [Candidatus Daviesbacteria bacterium GW2011_GWA2_42_7]